MLVELHILQNFAPANLNRDDTGAPKDCVFGGYRRARISSQCIKRSIRDAFKAQELLPEANRAVRTARLIEKLVTVLAAKGHPADQARAVAETALKGMGLAVETTGLTQYLLFLGNAEVAALAEVCDAYWEALSGIAAEAAAPGAKPARGTSKEAKKAGKEAVPAEIRKAFQDILDGGKAADVALFGRMVADRPEFEVDASCQVAHAISTNRVSMEFDFYTAVDDLKPGDTAGADMLGTVEFNSACFYRYANVNLGLLSQNLGGDEELARRSLEAFLRASINAIPTGKQNSFAAQNPPSFVFAVARTSHPWSLANAFLNPVRPSNNADLMHQSVLALDDYWGRLVRMYGSRGIAGRWWDSLGDEQLVSLKDARVDGVEKLVQSVLDTADFAHVKESVWA